MSENRSYPESIRKTLAIRRFESKYKFSELTNRETICEAIGALDLLNTMQYVKPKDYQFLNSVLHALLLTVK